ncbi:MAG: ATP-binding protein [Acidimicrobiales bacterium]
MERRPFAPEALSVRAARDFVATVLRVNVFEGDADAALLLVSELATNAVRHAGTPFEVTVEVRGPSVRVAVIDGDISHPPRVRRPGADETSGRGLLIVEELAERWGTEVLGDGSKSVWFVLA